MDKFKFVLDFKIRELKQQIEPRQQEIMAMREKIKEMDTELERYHKSNSALDVLIGELRKKIDELQQQVKAKRMQAKTLENTIETCRSDVQTAISHIQTHPTLVQHVKGIVAAYGSMENVRPRIDPEVEAEYARHREYLQRTIQELKLALEEGGVHHMTVNNQIRQNNMNLINEINTQRDSNRQLKNHVQAEIGRIRHFAQSLNMKKSKLRGASQKEPLKIPTSLFAGDEEEQDNLDPIDLLDKNRRRIAALRAAIDALEQRSRSVMQKAMSREVLPPMEGVESISGNSQVGSLPQIADARAQRNSGESEVRKKSIGKIELPPVHKPVTKQLSAQLDMGDSMLSPGDYPMEHMQMPQSPDSNPGPTYTTQYVAPDADQQQEGEQGYREQEGHQLEQEEGAAMMLDSMM